MFNSDVRQNHAKMIHMENSSNSICFKNDASGLLAIEQSLQVIQFGTS